MVVKIEPATIIAKSDNFIESNVDDEAILMHLGEGNFSSVRSTGLRIWQIINQPKSVAQICDILRAEFDVSETQCHEETVGFLRDLHEHGYIAIAPKDRFDQT